MTDAHWQRMPGRLPVTPVYDLKLKGADLVVGTHGRSFWILDDITPLRALCDGSRRTRLFPPRDDGPHQAAFRRRCAACAPAPRPRSPSASAAASRRTEQPDGAQERASTWTWARTRRRARSCIIGSRTATPARSRSRSATPAGPRSSSSAATTRRSAKPNAPPPSAASTASFGTSNTPARSRSTRRSPPRPARSPPRATTRPARSPSRASTGSSWPSGGDAVRHLHASRPTRACRRPRRTMRRNSRCCRTLTGGAVAAARRRSTASAASSAGWRRVPEELKPSRPDAAQGRARGDRGCAGRHLAACRPATCCAIPPG